MTCFDALIHKIICWAINMNFEMCNYIEIYRSYYSLTSVVYQLLQKFMTQSVVGMCIVAVNNYDIITTNSNRMHSILDHSCYTPGRGKIVPRNLTLLV